MHEGDGLAQVPPRRSAGIDIDVDEFVAARASCLDRLQQHSKGHDQRFPYQLLRNHRVQQISTGLGIWFGTRRPLVQIQSPRPILLNSILCKQQNSRRPPGNVPAAETSGYRSKVQSISGIGTGGHTRQIQNLSNNSQISFCKHRRDSAMPTFSR